MFWKNAEKLRKHTSLPSHGKSHQKFLNFMLDPKFQIECYLSWFLKLSEKCKILLSKPYSFKKNMSVDKHGFSRANFLSWIITWERVQRTLNDRMWVLLLTKYSEQLICSSIFKFVNLTKNWKLVILHSIGVFTNFWIFLFLKSTDFSKIYAVCKAVKLPDLYNETGPGSKFIFDETKILV